MFQKMEADDQIGVITKYWHLKEPIMIIAEDGDFKQLQKFKNVKQFSPIKGKFVVEKNPEHFLMTKIIKGDGKDGIPNILSAEDVLVTEGVRQKSITAKKLEQWINTPPEDFCDESMLKRFNMNQKLIDFDHIPAEHVVSIKTELERLLETPKANKVYKYLIKNKYRNLIDEAQFF